MGEAGCDGGARLTWNKIEDVRDWALWSSRLAYLLRTNVLDWTDEELWKTYMEIDRGRGRVQDSQIRFEHSSDLWHQKEERVLPHCSGLLSGVRAVEGAKRSSLARSRAGRRTATRTGRGSPRSDLWTSSCQLEDGTEDPSTLRLRARPSTSRSCWIGSDCDCPIDCNPEAKLNNPKSNVVEKSGVPVLRHKDLRRRLGKLG